MQRQFSGYSALYKYAIDPVLGAEHTENKMQSLEESQRHWETQRRCEVLPDGRLCGQRHERRASSLVDVPTKGWC